MKTAISVPDDTFHRVEQAAKRLGVSRSEFYARAAQIWLATLDEDDTTAAINEAVAHVGDEREFTAAAAAALISRSDD